MKTAIAIVDDNASNRRSLAGQLQFSSQVVVNLLAGSGADFLTQMKALPVSEHPAVVLMDIEMPGTKGTEVVKYARALYPDLKFLMLTAFDDDDLIFEAIKNGASGYLLKEESATVILRNIQELLEVGGAPMSPPIARKALNLLSRSQLDAPASPKAEPAPALSARELEVLRLLVAGKDYKAIAEQLFLSTHTIRKHIANIYEKLHVSSKAQAINLALQQSWFGKP
jgi:DNA-binding NarL/FixJ family response regulator